MSEQSTRWGGGLWAAADLVTPMAIRVAATLRLADHLAAGTHTSAALAAAVGVDHDALDRVMRHLVTAGVLAREAGGYRLTSLGEGLRDDHPDGVRAWIDLDGPIGRGDLCFVELLHTVRTGTPAFPRRFGAGFWDDLATDPDRSASFDALMGGRLAADAPVVATALDWGAVGQVVDVGGGDGTLLIAILREHPDLRGTVLDLAGPIARASTALDAAGLSDRADAQEGSFFDPLPAGAGGYLLSGVLHDWDDAHARRILQRCVEAATSTATGSGSGAVFVVDHFAEVGGESSDGLDDATAPVDTEGDLRMLCYLNGRERTLGQLGELAASAGLQVGSVTPAGTRSIVELRPR